MNFIKFFVLVLWCFVFDWVDIVSSEREVMINVRVEVIVVIVVMWCCCF